MIADGKQGHGNIAGLILVENEAGRIIVKSPKGGQKKNEEE